MQAGLRRAGAWFGLGAFAVFVLGAAPARSENRCQVLKYRLSGIAARAQARCKAQAIATEVAVDGCLTRAAERLAQRWAEVEARDDCLTTGDAGAVQSAVDALFAELSILLEPPPARCCEQGSTCLYFPGPAECEAFLGTPGQVIDRCDAVTGSCLPQQSGLGECCQLATTCIAGLNLFNCSDFGGGIISNATCLPSGLCGTP
jgi:hypothetical protein